nr:agamous-like MADS-box protein AGL104 [Ipomoea batatas]
MQSLICTLGKLQMETELTNERITPAGHKRQAEMQQQELRKEILDLQQQLNIAEAKLRAFEPDIRKLASFYELEECQHRLVEALGRVRQRKETLTSNHLSSNDNTMKINAEFENMKNATYLPEGETNNPVHLSSGYHTSSQWKLSSSSTTPTFYNDAMSQTSGNGDSFSGVHVLSDGQQWQPSFSFYPRPKEEVKKSLVVPLGLEMTVERLPESMLSVGGVVFMDKWSEKPLPNVSTAAGFGEFSFCPAAAAVISREPCFIGADELTFPTPTQHPGLQRHP